MNANKPALGRSLKSDLARVDAHKIKKGEYAELPEFTEEMFERASIDKGGRPISLNPGSNLPCGCLLRLSSGGRRQVQGGRREWPII